MKKKFLIDYKMYEIPVMLNESMAWLFHSVTEFRIGKYGTKSIVCEEEKLHAWMEEMHEKNEKYVKIIGHRYA